MLNIPKDLKHYTEFGISPSSAILDSQGNPITEDVAGAKNGESDADTGIKVYFEIVQTDNGDTNIFKQEDRSDWEIIAGKNFE